MNKVYLDSKMVPNHLRGGYSGKQFSAIVSDNVNIPSCAGLWDGGSRDTYKIVRLADGKEIEGSDNMSAPWDKNRADRIVKLEPGFAVVCHSIFCGKDMGLTFYVCAIDAAKILPAPVKLSENEKLILKATKNFKPNYGGKDRYDMMRDNISPSWKTDAPAFMSRDTWNNVKAELIVKGYLNKAGAITVLGKNAISFD
jgi:hypothetical protein